jgi:PTH1 family peptidyl-tRNA hydrolase
MSFPVRLIIGLGNPGEEYTRTRHNAGVWFIEKIAAHYHLQLRNEKKFLGQYGNFLHHGERIHLLVPATFMNHSGQAVRAVTDFYQIASVNMLVAHDELDITTGDIRLKYAGGHGGHNGLKDIISHLHTPDFYRLRVGIAHPGDRHKVTPYVLSAPSHEERNHINDGLDKALDILDSLLKGEAEKAMQKLHTG